MFNNHFFGVAQVLNVNEPNLLEYQTVNAGIVRIFFIFLNAGANDVCSILTFSLFSQVFPLDEAQSCNYETNVDVLTPVLLIST